MKVFSANDFDRFFLADGPAPEEIIKGRDIRSATMAYLDKVSTSTLTSNEQALTVYFFDFF